MQGIKKFVPYKLKINMYSKIIYMIQIYYSVVY